MEIKRNLGNTSVVFPTDPARQTEFTVKLTDAELEQAYTEFLERKFVRDTRYFLEENYIGEVDEETIASIASDYKESLGDKVGKLECETFDDVMELNYPEIERNW